MKCKHGIKDCKNDGKEEICGACNIKDFMGAPEYEPEKENANSGYPLLADVGELLDKIDEHKKDFNPYNFCDYEKLLWGQILRLADKLRANVS